MQNRRMVGLSVLILMALALVCARPAAAQTTEYTDQAAFDAATSNLTTIDFGGIAPAGGSSFFGEPGSVALSGVTFTSNPGSVLFVVDDNFGFPDAYFAGGPATLSSQIGPPNETTAFLPAGTTAVGADVDGLVATYNYTVTLSNGSSFNYLAPPTGPGTTPGFLGFTVGSGTISSINFNAGANSTAIANFQFGTSTTSAPVVPESSSLALVAGFIPLAIGAGLLSFRRRKAFAA